MGQMRVTGRLRAWTRAKFFNPEHSLGIFGGHHK
jgi:hypothetical protein